MSKLPFTYAERQQPQATFASLASAYAWEIAEGIGALIVAGVIVGVAYVFADALGAFQ